MPHTRKADRRGRESDTEGSVSREKSVMPSITIISDPYAENKAKTKGSMAISNSRKIILSKYTTGRREKEHERQERLDR